MIDDQIGGAERIEGLEPLSDDIEESQGFGEIASLMSCDGAVVESLGRLKVLLHLSEQLPRALGVTFGQNYLPRCEQNFAATVERSALPETISITTTSCDRTA
jgi:hypothetical protein